MLSLTAAAQVAAVRRLGPPADPESLFALDRFLRRLTDHAIDRIGRILPPVAPLACGEGCAWCCHMVVVVDAVTLLALAGDPAPPPLPDPARGPAARRWRLADRQPAAPAFAWTCPLLADDRCVVYDRRPPICRAQNAFRADDCRDKVRGGGGRVVGDAVPPALVGAVADGLAQGFDALGLDPADARLELTAALAVARAHPDPARAWLSGAPLFAPARVPEAAARGR